MTWLLVSLLKVFLALVLITLFVALLCEFWFTILMGFAIFMGLAFICGALGSLFSRRE